MANGEEAEKIATGRARINLALWHLIYLFLFRFSVADLTGWRDCVTDFDERTEIWRQ